MKPWTAVMALAAVAGCAMPPGTWTAATQNADLVAGPPIEDVVTSFDRSLSCLRGKIQPGVIFAVGNVVDATAKETYADGGTGKFVTQGAGEMVQSALFRAGVSVVNRRDANISIVESNWGIRDIKRQVPVNFYISGSINSLDFIPGGGISAQVAGIGPRNRQSRILVALDLTMTDAYTGRVVASIPLQKQIYTREMGISGNTFFGDTLVQFDAGGMEREALHFALRQMLSLATFELLGQLMNQEVYAGCRRMVAADAGMIRSHGTADVQALAEVVKAMKETSPPPALEVPVSKSDVQPSAVGQSQASQSAQASQQGVDKPVVAPSVPPTDAVLKGQKATQTATQAIRVARESQGAADQKTAMVKAAEALRLSNLALLLLQEAAQAGFSGDEGEVAAVVVQQGLQAAQEAGAAAASREAVAETSPPESGTPTSNTVASADVAVSPASEPEPTAPIPPTGGPRVDPRFQGGR